MRADGSPRPSASRTPTPRPTFGKAIHCGFLEGAGSSFLDSSCNDAPKYQPNSWDAGTYYGRSNCEQAGRNAIASGGRANHYRCYRNDGEKFTLTLSV